MDKFKKIKRIVMIIKNKCVIKIKINLCNLYRMSFIKIIIVIKNI